MQNPYSHSWRIFHLYDQKKSKTIQTDFFFFNLINVVSVFLGNLCEYGNQDTKEMALKAVVYNFCQYLGYLIDLWFYKENLIYNDF